MNNNIINFSILKFFDIQTKPRKGTRPIQVIWKMLEVGWIKINTDEIAKKCMGYAIYSDFLRGNQGDYIGSFTSFMGVQNSIC